MSSWTRINYPLQEGSVCPELIDEKSSVDTKYTALSQFPKHTQSEMFTTCILQFPSRVISDYLPLFQKLHSEVQTDIKRCVLRSVGSIPQTVNVVDDHDSLMTLWSLFENAVFALHHFDTQFIPTLQLFVLSQVTSSPSSSGMRNKYFTSVLLKAGGASVP
eukprot:PhF_6_TR3449/c0_g2_i2/m.5026